MQGVGYPNPNRSHFDSMAIWHTARTSVDKAAPGWLARAIDRRPGLQGDAPALHIHDAFPLPGALAGGQNIVPSMARLEQFRRRLGMPQGMRPPRRWRPSITWRARIGASLAHCSSLSSGAV